MMDDINNKLSTLIDLIKNNFNENWEKLVQLAIQFYGQPEKFWRKFNILRGSKREETSYLILQNENLDSSDSDGYGEITTEIITDKKEQAIAMSEAWAPIFTENISADYENNLNIQKINEWYDNHEHLFIQNDFIDYNLLKQDHPILRPFTMNELNNTIKRTRDKTPGPSGIRLNQIKLLPTNCKEIILNIYNAIIVTKYYPNPLEKINMIFIPKPNKDKTSPLGYRPLCMLEILIKIFEKTITQRILYFLEHNNLLSEKQFGFRPQRSTTHAITLANMTLNSNYLNEKTTLIASRDVMRCFDTVWHKGLLAKMDDIFSSIEDRIDILILIKEFLEIREITPIFNNEKGNVIRPTAGVPQGSSCGPVLFLIFANDHPKPIHNDTVILQYADDMTHIVCSDGSGPLKTKQAIMKLEQELEQTLTWENNWKIKTNLQKCTIHYNRTSKPTIEKFGGVKTNNINIPITNETKILGLHFKHNTKGNLHSKNIAKKARLNINKLYRFKNAPQNIKRTLYKTLILPILEYPCTALYNMDTKYKKKLQTIQNKGIRFIKNIKIKDRIRMEDAHKELNIPPLNVRISKLNNKTLNTMKETYYVKSDQPKNITYKYSDYNINSPPLRKRRRTIAQHIDKHILKPRNHPNVIKEVDSIDTWQEPTPIYTSTFKPASN